MVHRRGSSSQAWGTPSRAWIGILISRPLLSVELDRPSPIG